MDDIYFKIIIGLVTIVGALIGIIYKGLLKSIENIENSSKQNFINLENSNKENFIDLENKFNKKFKELELDSKENFSKIENQFENKFKVLEFDVKENNIKIKEIISRQDTEIQLINKQIVLLDTEIKYLGRRLNKVEGFDSDHY